MLPDGQAVFAIVPLRRSVSLKPHGQKPGDSIRGGHDAGSKLEISPPMKLAAMEAANTVSVHANF